MEWSWVCNNKQKIKEINKKGKLHPYTHSLSFSNTHTHILFKGPNPLSESVSLVVTNTTGLFVSVCVWCVMCVCIKGRDWMRMCDWVVCETCCLWAACVKQAGEVRERFNRKPVFSAKQFVLYSFTRCVCVCVCVHSHPACVCVRAACDWLSLGFS